MLKRVDGGQCNRLRLTTCQVQTYVTLRERATPHTRAVSCDRRAEPGARGPRLGTAPAHAASATSLLLCVLALRRLALNIISFLLRLRHERESPRRELDGSLRSCSRHFLRCQRTAEHQPTSPAMSSCTSTSPRVAPPPPAPHASASSLRHLCCADPCSASALSAQHGEQLDRAPLRFSELLYTATRSFSKSSGVTVGGISWTCPGRSK